MKVTLKVTQSCLTLCDAVRERRNKAQTMIKVLSVRPLFVQIEYAVLGLAHVSMGPINASGIIYQLEVLCF